MNMIERNITWKKSNYTVDLASLARALRKCTSITFRTFSSLVNFFTSWYAPTAWTSLPVIKKKSSLLNCHHCVEGRTLPPAFSRTTARLNSVCQSLASSARAVSSLVSASAIRPCIASKLPRFTSVSMVIFVRKGGTDVVEYEE